MEELPAGHTGTRCQILLQITMNETDHKPGTYVPPNWQKKKLKKHSPIPQLEAKIHASPLQIMKKMHLTPLQVYPARGTGTPVTQYTDMSAPRLPAKVAAANGNLHQGARDQKGSIVLPKAPLCAQHKVSS